jgi:hypothetical protein
LPIANRQSSTRIVHDAEAEDIFGMIEIVDNLNVFDNIKFTTAALHRLSQYVWAKRDKRLRRSR